VRWNAFSARPALERLALVAAAWHLPDEQSPYWSPGEATFFPEAAGAAAEACGADYALWLAATVDPWFCAQTDVIQAAFRSLDVDGDGKISPDDIRRSVAGPCYSRCTEEFDTLLSEADALLGGGLHFGDFAALLAGCPGKDDDSFYDRADDDAGDAVEQWCGYFNSSRCTMSPNERTRASSERGRPRCCSGESCSTAPSTTESFASSCGAQCRQG